MLPHHLVHDANPTLRRFLTQRNPIKYATYATKPEPTPITDPQAQDLLPPSIQRRLDSSKHSRTNAARRLASLMGMDLNGQGDGEESLSNRVQTLVFSEKPRKHASTSTSGSIAEGAWQPRRRRPRAAMAGEVISAMKGASWLLKKNEAARRSAGRRLAEKMGLTLDEQADEQAGGERIVRDLQRRVQMMTLPNGPNAPRGRALGRLAAAGGPVQLPKYATAEQVLGASGRGIAVVSEPVLPPRHATAEQVLGGGGVGVVPAVEPVRPPRHATAEQVLGGSGGKRGEPELVPSRWRETDRGRYDDVWPTDRYRS